MPLSLSKPLVIFDIETTGTNIVTDRIVEISLVKLQPDHSRQLFTSRINPGIPIPAEVTRIHGITDEDVKDKPSFRELAGQIKHFIDDADLGGYNAIRFDIPILVEEFMRAGVDFDFDKRRFVDVLNIYHKMEPRNLPAAYRFYCDKKLEAAHSAEADTLATLEVLLAQVEKYHGQAYTNKYGQTTTLSLDNMNDLQDFSYHSRFVDLAGTIVYNDKGVEVFNIGKHKGKAVTDVFRDEPSYYDWMMKADFALYTKKVITSLKMRGFGDKRE
ncbi:MAG TPA: 3'-5' exonuclease [Bacteroidales bacterium]|nr:3'-5' exonuclease [Bacteroidales bacterium]HSA42535.1 3'-5' exonuclease [Bacteroidales bacterium]